MFYRMTASERKIQWKQILHVHQHHSMSRLSIWDCSESVVKTSGPTSEDLFMKCMCPLYYHIGIAINWKVLYGFWHDVNTTHPLIMYALVSKNCPLGACKSSSLVKQHGWLAAKHWLDRSLGNPADYGRSVTPGWTEGYIINTGDTGTTKSNYFTLFNCS